MLIRSECLNKCICQSAFWSLAYITWGCAAEGVKPPHVLYLSMNFGLILWWFIGISLVKSAIKCIYVYTGAVLLVTESMELVKSCFEILFLPDLWEMICPSANIKHFIKSLWLSSSGSSCSFPWSVRFHTTVLCPSIYLPGCPATVLLSLGGLNKELLTLPTFPTITLSY